MGENLADLAMVLQQADSRGNGAMGRLYAAHWEQPDRVHQHRWRGIFALGLMALARCLAPEAYERQLQRPAGPARSTAGATASLQAS